MKSKSFFLLIAMALLLNSNVVFSQVFLTATGGTPSATYSTMKLAFDAINTGTHTGTIVITVGSTDGQIITETAQASLNKSGVGSASYSGISIFPGAANIKITGAISGACCIPSGTIKLNQAENVTVDGRQGGVGSIIDLTIENTTVGSYSSAFVFFAASNNTLRYCVLKSATTGSCCGVGTISITDNNTSGGTGSNNNVIEYCNITKSGSNIPRRAVFGKGAGGRENTNNIIRNCNIYDFQEYGIFIGNSTSGEGYNRSWIIKDNAIYQTMLFATMNYNQIGICVGNPFSSSYGEQGTFTVEGNTVGGNSFGGDWTCYSTLTRRVAGISINTSTSVYSYIYGNTISNFDVKTTNTSTDYGIFSGIVVSNGKVDIKNNIIGSLTQSDNIKIARNNTSNGGFVSGIQVRSSSDLANKINYNTVSAISLTTGSSDFYNFYGIRNTSSTTYPKDSICYNNVSYLKSTKVNYCVGIYGQGLIAKNRVRDIDFIGAASFSELTGIRWGGGKITVGDSRGVENNEVILGLNKTGASVAENDIITGIEISRGDADVYYNSVLIQGTGTGSDNSYAIELPSTGTVLFNNNLMYNERTGGTGKHYAINKLGAGTSFISSNNAYVIGTTANNLVGLWSGADQTTLSNWQAISGETNSIDNTTTGMPTSTLFPLLTQDYLDVPDPTWVQAGTSLVPPTTDITNIVRSTTLPTIGAYEKSMILPIELLSFEANCINNQVQLTWATTSEINNDYFTIERSVDAIHFEELGTTKGAGNSNTLKHYNFDDNITLPETVYYILKQTDYDGRFKYSEIITVKCNNTEENNFIIYPNPAKENLTIYFNTKLYSDFKYNITDCLGRKLIQGNLNNGERIFKLDLNNLTSGMYMIIIFNEHVKYNRSLIKE